MPAKTLRKATELCDRKPTIADVRQGCDHFDFINLETAEVSHAIWCGDGWLLVVSDFGACEWVYVSCGGTHQIEEPHFAPRLQRDEAWEHSNDGWGSEPPAMLAGLLHVEGASCSQCGRCVLPDDVEIRCPKCG